MFKVLTFNYVEHLFMTDSSFMEGSPQSKMLFEALIELGQLASLVRVDPEINNRKVPGKNKVC